MGNGNAATPKSSDVLRAELKRLDRREWSLWAVAIFSLLLLCVAILSLALPRVVNAEELLFTQRLDLGVRSLFGIVLLFSVFVLYQQVLIKHLRTHLDRELSERLTMEARTAILEELATQDALTGLYNRRYAMEQLVSEAARSDRYGYPLTVLVLDLDDFKDVNDQYGHGAGDMALQEFARWLRRAIRNSDVPVRMGGDEFMVLLPECGLPQMNHPLHRMEGCSVEFDGHKIPVKFSAGWAQREKDESVDRFLQRADQALYENKRKQQHAAATATSSP